jgi:hypothetical protein
MTNQEAQKHLCRKLNIEYTDVVAGNNDLWTELDLQTLIQLGVTRAWDYKPWEFTEGAKTGTTTSTYLDYPQDVQSGSIFLLRVNSKEYKKLLFQDYLKYLEDNPTATDRIWSEYKRFIYINTNAYTVGQSYDVFGKLMPPALSASGDLLPFSPDTDNYEHSGNEAIVLLAYGEALDSEKKKNPSQAEVERGKAYQMLDLLWKPMKDARALLQSKNRPMWETPDYFGGNTNQSTIGNFN